jgi:uncharacterized protein YcfJ
VPKLEDIVMNTSRLVSVTVGSVLMAAGALLSTAQAEVVCRDVPVTRTAPPQDQHRLLGTAAGAALGGLLGSQFGGGAVNTGATAAGVLAGGYAGNKIQERTQQGNTYTTYERQCTEVSRY